MFTNPFDQAPPKIIVPDSCKVIFVSDLFASDYVGGAELTTQALIDSSPHEVFCIKSKEVNMEVLESGSDKYWVFGNYSAMDMNLIK